ncbi:hypothetical protein Bpfe_008510, partial [Biomphalaria pfeifferi]
TLQQYTPDHLQSTYYDALYLCVCLCQYVSSGIRKRRRSGLDPRCSYEIILFYILI